MSLKFKATSNYTFNTDISFRGTIYSESGCNVNANSKTIVTGYVAQLLSGAPPPDRKVDSISEQPMQVR